MLEQHLLNATRRNEQAFRPVHAHDSISGRPPGNPDSDQLRRLAHRKSVAPGGHSCSLNGVARDVKRITSVLALLAGSGGTVLREVAAAAIPIDEFMSGRIAHALENQLRGIPRHNLRGASIRLPHLRVELQASWRGGIVFTRSGQLKQ